MIPKTIHYCWFGGNKKPTLFKKCYKSWEKYCPDYEIIEWNEGNFDISSCPLYVRQAYEAKKWAFVTDYVRLKVIYDNGGIYFDTDVELKKNPDFLLDNKAFFGFENGGNVATGLGFGAEKGTEILQEMMQDYDNIPFIKEDGSFDTMPCPERNTKVFLKHGLVKVDKTQLLDNGILVLQTVILNPMNFETGQVKITEETVAIHWYSASWHTKQESRKRKMKAFRVKLLKIVDFVIPDIILRKVLGEYLFGILKSKTNTN